MFGFPPLVFVESCCVQFSWNLDFHDEALKVLNILSNCVCVFFTLNFLQGQGFRWSGWGRKLAHKCPAGARKSESRLCHFLPRLHHHHCVWLSAGPHVLCCVTLLAHGPRFAAIRVIRRGALHLGTSSGARILRSAGIDLLRSTSAWVLS